MFPALLTFAGMKCAGSFASHVMAHATANMISNTLVETIENSLHGCNPQDFEKESTGSLGGLPLTHYSDTGRWVLSKVTADM
jgi:hypothetical protein